MKRVLAYIYIYIYIVGHDDVYHAVAAVPPVALEPDCDGGKDNGDALF